MSHRVSYSVVTRAELLSGDVDIEVVRLLLAPFRELRVGRETAERAGRLRRESELSLPDALIAATAMEHELDLFTRNRSAFEGIRGLRVRELT